MVGTQIGDVHRQRQGTGFATILPQGDEIQYAYAMSKEYKAAQEKKRADKEAALSKLKAPQDYWYRHDGELKASMQEIQDLGTALIQKDIDPFKAATPEALEFRKKYDRAMQLSAASKQVKEQFTKYTTDLSNGNPDDYDDAAIAAIDQFYAKPLSEIVDNNIVAPHLMKKRPYLDAFNFVGKNMSEWSKGWNENIPDDNKTLDFVQALVQDPANRENVIRTYGAKLAQMSPAERQYIDDRAKKAMVEPHVIMAFDDANRWKEMQKPFDPLKVLSTAAKTVEGGLDYSISADPNRMSKRVNEKDLEKALETAAVATFNNRPEWFDYYAQKVQRDPSENDGEYSRRVINAIKEDIRPLVGIEKESRLTDRGKDEQELKARRNQWIQDIRSTDPIRKASAAQWVTNMSIFGNLNVENARIEEDMFGPKLVMIARTDLDIKDIEMEVAGATPGVSDKQIVVVDRQGEKVIEVSLGDQSNPEIANQTLAAIYDTQYKQRKENYDPNISEFTPKKGNIAVPLKTDNLPKTKAPGQANSLFKF